MKAHFARRVVGSLLAVVAVASSGCASVFLQDDGFAAKIPQGCTTKAGCEDLKTEAENRVTRCKANTVGYVRCDEAHADLHTVSAKLARFHDADRAEKFEVARRHSEEELEERKLELLRARRERDAEEQRRAAERARREWSVETAKTCARANDPLACDSADAAITEADKQDCRDKCSKAVAFVSEQIYAYGLTACTANYAAGHGRRPAVCSFRAPNGEWTWTPDERKGACETECVARGKEALLQAASEARPMSVAPRPAAIETRSAVRRTSASSSDSGGAVRCCDGSPSPTCTYDRGSLRGCCSHHGGVC